MDLGSTIALECESAPERAFRVPISTEIPPGQREGLKFAGCQWGMKEQKKMEHETETCGSIGIKQIGFEIALLLVSRE